MAGIFFLLCILVCGFSQSQTKDYDTRPQSVSLHVGVNQIKEENLHPKVHSGAISGLSYTSYKLSGKGSFFELGLLYSSLKSGFEDQSASINGQLFFEYGRLYALIAEERHTISIGPKIGLGYNISHYPNWDESHLYWANDLNLGAKSIVQYRLSDKTTLLANLGLTFISLLSRPEKDRQYKIDDFSFGGILQNFHFNPEMAPFHKALKFSLKKEFQFRLADTYMQSIFYQYHYSRMDSNHAHLFQNSLHAIGLKFYFL